MSIKVPTSSNNTIKKSFNSVTFLDDIRQIPESIKRKRRIHNEKQIYDDATNLNGSYRNVCVWTIGRKKDSDI